MRNGDARSHSFGEQNIHVFKTEARPGFVTCGIFHSFRNRNELGAYDSASSTGGGLICHLHDVNDERDPNRSRSRRGREPVVHDATVTGRCVAGYGYGSVSGGKPVGDGFSFATTARVMACSCTASTMTM